MQQKTRNVALDIARGIMGLLIVIGHTLVFRYQEGWFYQMTHLATPFFIFISGVFLKPDEPLRDSLLRHTDSLLKPYGVMLLATGFFYSLIGSVPLLPYLAGTLYATGQTILLLPLWFLPHLFLCILVSVLLLRVCRRLQLSRYGYAFLLLALLWGGQALIGIVWSQPLPDGMLQWLLGPASHWPGLPWSADLLPLTVSFMLSGYLLSEKMKAFAFRFWPALLAIALTVMFSVLDAMHINIGTVDMNRRVYRSPLFTSIFIAVGIHAVFSVAALCGRIRWLRVSLSWFGRRFLVVLLLHLLVQRFLFRYVSYLGCSTSMQVLVVFAGTMILLVLLIELVYRSRLLSWLLLPAGKYRKAL